MSEQSGQAAGTAEPTKPIFWRALDSAFLPSMIEIVDESGHPVGIVYRSQAERLLACVNFCAHYSTEILASIDHQKLRVVVERANPQIVQDEVDRFCANSKQFHADQAGITGVSLPGGAL
jgi:hypothetical protein